MMAYKVLTANTPSEAFFWILVIRGVGLGLLSIPITTMALSTLKGRKIGQGAAISGMLRQLGGSFGVAIISNYLTSDIQKYRSDLLGNLSATDPAVQQRIKMIAGGFHSKGLPTDLATKSADKLLDGLVDVQSTVLSYMDVFLWIGFMFFDLCPVRYFFRKKGKTESGSEPCRRIIF